MSWEIRQGDVLDQLREMPDESVHCCVTSPPYWGLRDYRTASWEHGDAGCDHIEGMARGDTKLRECGKCGAVRVDRQLGLEVTPELFTHKMAEVFREVRRVLRKDGVLWLNLGDSYAAGGQNSGSRPEELTVKQRSNGGCRYERRTVPPGLKSKDLVGIPWRVAFALQSDGWYLRSDVIWAKSNGMPESVTDRPVRAHEHLFMLTKSARYWSDFDAIKTPPRESSMVRRAEDVQAQAGSHRANGGSNGAMKVTDKQRGHSRRHAGFNDRWDAMEKAHQQQAMPASLRDVWFIAPATFDGAHFAVMPEEMVRRCILTGCPEDGTVLDPFSGSGTTGMVALRHHRNYIGIELNPEYVEMSRRRIEMDMPLFNQQEVTSNESAN